MTNVDARRVMVIEDDDFVRGMIAHILSNSGFDVVASADVNDATSKFDDFDPDALVVDIHLGPGPTGIEVAQALKSRSPWLAVLAVSNYPSTASAGVSESMADDFGFVRKQSLSDPTALLEALELVLRNQSADIASADTGSLIDALTPTQRDVLRLMAEGWSNTEIAERRGATVRAVESLTSRIFARLGVADDSRRSPRVEAVRLFTEAYGPVEHRN